MVDPDYCAAYWTSHTTLEFQIGERKFVTLGEEASLSLLAHIAESEDQNLKDLVAQLQEQRPIPGF